MGAPFSLVTQPWHGTLPLAGDHQRWNAALAVAAVQTAGFCPPDSVIAKGLAQTVWPARFQKVNEGRIIIDGAHNPHGAMAAVAAWRQAFGEERATVIFGAVAAKDYAEALQQLAAVAHRFFFVTLRNPRAVPAEILAASAPPNSELSTFSSLAEALQTARSLPERQLICGSLYLCGEALSLINHAEFEPSAQ